MSTMKFYLVTIATFLLILPVFGVSLVKRSASPAESDGDDNFNTSDDNRRHGVSGSGSKAAKEFKDLGDKTAKKMAGDSDVSWKDKAARGREIEERGNLVQERERGNGNKIRAANKASLIKAMEDMEKAGASMMADSGMEDGNNGDSKNRGDDDEDPPRHKSRKGKDE